MTILDSSLRGLTDIINSSFDQKDIDIVSIKDVILHIHAIPSKDKKKYEDLYKAIGDLLFINDITLSEYQPNHFETKVKVHKIKSPAFDSELDFFNQLRKLIDCCHKDLEILNKCIILRFGDDKALPYSYILIHDTHFRPSVFIKVKTKFNEECKIFQIDSFIEDLKNSKIEKKENFIVLLVLSLL